MKTPLKRPLLLLSCLLSGACAPWAGAVSAAAPPVACVAPLQTGFTLTHENVRVDADKACAQTRSGGASLDAAHYILRNYADPAARARVRGLLQTMRADGAATLRTIAWIRHVEDAPMGRRRHDPLGLLVATKGRLDEADIASLLAFAGDVEAAGYERMTLVISSQGTANPKCRKEEWGQCHDAGLLPLSWSVVEQIVTALRARKPGSMKVVADIAPTACFEPESRQLVHRNLAHYVRFMVGRYQQKFGNGGFIASCGAARGDRALPAIRALGQLYTELSLTPDAMDVHVYETDAAKVREVLIGADAEASRLGVPLDILETFYDHPTLFDVVRELRAAGGLRSLRTVQVFPRRTASACQEDVAAPYDIKRLRGSLVAVPVGGTPGTCGEIRR